VLSNSNRLAILTQPFVSGDDAEVSGGLLVRIILFGVIDLSFFNTPSSRFVNLPNVGLSFYLCLILSS
jgi:hypothetical protein